MFIMEGGGELVVPERFGEGEDTTYTCPVCKGPWDENDEHHPEHGKEEEETD